MGKPNFEALFEGSDGGVPPTFTTKKLPVGVREQINVLPQPRLTFDPEELKNLSESISVSGLMNGIIIVEFYTRKECENYLSVINEIWKTNFEFTDLKRTQEKGRRFYRILVAGERRFRAIGLALANGSYKRKTIPVTIATNTTTFRAIFLQWQENTHQPVPAHEDAKATAELFKVVRKARPKIAKTEFARLISRTPRMVTNALRFSELPLKIQSMVTDGTIRYGIALELTRLQENGSTQADLLDWIRDVLAENLSVEKFRFLVSAYLEHKKNGQESLFDTMKDVNERIERQLNRRKVVEKNVIHFLWAEHAYFRVILRLFEEELLGLEDSPFSEGSPIRHLLALVETLDKLDKHLGKVLSKKKRARVKAVTKKVGKTAQKLLKEVENVA